MVVTVAGELLAGPQQAAKLGEQVGVRDHDALGWARRPRRVLQEQEVVAFARGGLRRRTERLQAWRKGV